MATLDLNVLRAARLEASGASGAHHVTIGTAHLELPVELPAELALYVRAIDANGVDFTAIVEALFGAAQAGEFWAQHPSLPDLEAFLDGVFHIYGLTTGESQPSAGPSPNGGASSRATSNGGTGSTSETPSGGLPGDVSALAVSGR